MKLRTIVLLVTVVTMGIAAIGVGYMLSGGAAYVTPGNGSDRAVQLTSDLSNSSSADNSSGIDFAVPSGLTLADISQISADYNFTRNSCIGASPRFEISVVTPANTTVTAFVFIGPPPNYTGCVPNVWTNTGNLAVPASFIDTTQLPGGVFFDTFAAANSKYGAYPVTGIRLVADAGAGFSDGIQTVLVDNVVINNTTYTFEPPAAEPAPPVEPGGAPPKTAEDCKDGGWKNFTSSPGPFKNQGDCVSYFATGGKERGKGH